MLQVLGSYPAAVPRRRRLVTKNILTGYVYLLVVMNTSQFWIVRLENIQYEYAMW